MALPVVEKHAMPSDSVDSEKEKPKAKKAKLKKRATSSVNPGLKSSIGSVSAQFKSEKQVRDFENGCRSSKGSTQGWKVDEPLALVEILKEIDYSDVAPSIRKWLPQVLKDEIIALTRSDKEGVLFYNDSV
ncbi:uncharacterized protein [Oscarella lobularis]|uniref:uncharacterized protein n=1 Tax=Oscarella lobularis TaxID=121494 RepID=UPI0033144B88